MSEATVKRIAPLVAQNGITRAKKKPHAVRSAA
jgi:hypothetical protein